MEQTFPLESFRKTRNTFEGIPLSFFAEMIGMSRTAVLLRPTSAVLLGELKARFSPRKCLLL